MQILLHIFLKLYEIIFLNEDIKTCFLFIFFLKEELHEFNVCVEGIWGDGNKNSHTIEKKNIKG